MHTQIQVLRFFRSIIAAVVELLWFGSTRRVLDDGRGFVFCGHDAGIKAKAQARPALVVML